MKNLLKIIRGLLATFLLTISMGCSDEFPDYYHQKEFDLDSFEKIKLGDAFQIEIRQAAEFSVIAKGEDRDLSDLQLEIVNGVLTGSYRAGSRSHKRSLIQISMPILKSAELHGATDTHIYSFGNLEENFILKISGASKVVSDTSWNLMDIQIDGASELVISGNSEDVEAKVNGASRIQAASLISKRLNIDVGGSSEALVNITENLSGSVNGSSLLRYRGNPESISVEVATDSRMIQF